MMGIFKITHALVCSCQQIRTFLLPAKLHFCYSIIISFVSGVYGQCKFFLFGIDLTKKAVRSCQLYIVFLLLRILQRFVGISFSFVQFSKISVTICKAIIVGGQVFLIFYP